MQIIIHESDFDINNQKTVKAFNEKLQKIIEPFEVKFDFPITKIPKNLFFNTYLSKITLPNSVTKIEGSAFEWCKNLTSIILPDSIIEIGFASFFNCISLTQIKLPNSIKMITSRAFEGCDSLRKIFIPNSVIFLNDDIFEQCCSLEQIIIQQSKKDFFKNVNNAEKFYQYYKEKIVFKDNFIDLLISENNSIESIINTAEER